MVSKWCSAQVPEECPAEIEQLIDLCLATEPADRPTAKQAFDIISCCNPHLPAPAPPTPPPIPHQQAAASADVPESWVQTPAIEPASVSSKDREQSLGGLPGSAHYLQSAFQQPATANGDSPSNMPAQRHQVLTAGQTVPSDGLRQYPPAGVSTATSQTPSDQDAGLQNGHQMPSRQQADDGAKHRSGTATLLTVNPTHSTNGSQDSLPLGVFGHLYPSPFAMADEGSGSSLWCWQHGQAASGSGSNQESSEPQN